MNPSIITECEASAGSVLKAVMTTGQIICEECKEYTPFSTAYILETGGVPDVLPICGKCREQLKGEDIEMICDQLSEHVREDIGVGDLDLFKDDWADQYNEIAGATMKYLDELPTLSDLLAACVEHLENYHKRPSYAR